MDSTVTVALIGSLGAFLAALATTAGVVVAKLLERGRSHGSEITASDPTAMAALTALVRESDAKDHLIDMWRERALRCEAQQERDAR